MRRALLWTGVGLLLFLGSALLLAPGALVGRALGLTLAAAVPATVVVLLARDARSRSDVYGGNVPADPAEDDEEDDEMDRTLRAALTAFLIGLVAVGGIAAFLGVPAGTSLVSGVVAGVLFGGLILAASRRSQGFHDDPSDPRP